MSDYEKTVKIGDQHVKEADEKLKALKDFHQQLADATVGSQSASISEELNKTIKDLQDKRNALSSALYSLKQSHSNYFEKNSSDKNILEKGAAIAQGIPGIVQHPITFTKTVMLWKEAKHDHNVELQKKITECQNCLEKLSTAMKNPAISDNAIADLSSQFLSRDRTGTISPP